MNAIPFPGDETPPAGSTQPQTPQAELDEAWAAIHRRQAISALSPARRTVVELAQAQMDTIQASHLLGEAHWKLLRRVEEIDLSPVLRMKINDALLLVEREKDATFRCVFMLTRLMCDALGELAQEEQHSDEQHSQEQHSHGKGYEPADE